MNQIPQWLAITQAAASTAGVIATTIGVLVALWVAISNSKKNREEREDRGRQLAALQRAEDDRIAAQARKVVPAVVPTAVFGPNMWSVKISNHSAAPITELGVSVIAADADGEEIPNGCEQANGKMGTSEVFRKVIADAIDGGVGAAVGSRRAGASLAGAGLGSFLGGAMGGVGGPMVGETLAPRVAPLMQEALNGQMTREWPTTLTPEQIAVMAFSAVDGTATLRASITFTDEAGYRWERADNGAPRQMGVAE